MLDKFNNSCFFFFNLFFIYGLGMLVFIELFIFLLVKVFEEFLFMLFVVFIVFLDGFYLFVL